VYRQLLAVNAANGIRFCWCPTESLTPREIRLVPRADRAPVPFGVLRLVLSGLPVLNVPTGIHLPVPTIDMNARLVIV
jgi:hypothetical protein